MARNGAPSRKRRDLQRFGKKRSYNSRHEKFQTSACRLPRANKATIVCPFSKNLHGRGKFLFIFSLEALPGLRVSSPRSHASPVVRKNLSRRRVASRCWGPCFRL